MGSVARLGHLAALTFVASIGCAQSPNATGASEGAASDELRAESPYEKLSIDKTTERHDVLEVASDGRAIVGSAIPVPPRSSAKLVYEAMFVEPDGRTHEIPFATRIQDARFAFAPSPWVAVLDDRDVLTLWNTRSGETWELDREVFPGFGFSHDAKSIAYAKGNAPELDAFIAPLPHGTPRQLTKNGMPVWGFAFSPDDQQLLYVDAPQGFPCLTLIPTVGGERTRFTNKALNATDLAAGAELAPFPETRKPPLWLGDRVYVENTKGVHAIDSFGTVVKTHEGGHQLHADVTGRVALFRAGDEIREVER